MGVLLSGLTWPAVYHRVGTYCPWTILFLLYINDLPDVVGRPLRMFTDDTKLLFCVSTNREVSQLQSDLDALALWTVTWLMSFNENKCKVLLIGHLNPLSQYTMRNSQIGITNVEKDLGVFVDAELNFGCRMQNFGTNV